MKSECYSAIPVICEGDAFISDPNTKADVFNDYFASQATASNNDSTEVPFLSRWSQDCYHSGEQMVRHLYLLLIFSKQ